MFDNGAVFKMASQTLITREGKEVPIEGNVALMKDKKGNISGHSLYSMTSPKTGS